MTSRIIGGRISGSGRHNINVGPNADVEIIGVENTNAGVMTIFPSEVRNFQKLAPRNPALQIAHPIATASAGMSAQ